MAVVCILEDGWWMMDGGQCMVNNECRAMNGRRWMVDDVWWTMYGILWMMCVGQWMVDDADYVWWTMYGG